MAQIYFFITDVTSEVTTSTSTLVTNTVTMTTTSITTTVSSNIPSSSSSVSVPSSKAKCSNTAKVNPGSEKSSRETNRDKEKSSHHKRDDHRSSSSKHKSSHHKSDRDMKHDGRSRKKSDKSDEARKDSMSSGKDKHDSGERHTCDKRNQGFTDKSNHHRKDKKDSNKSDPKGKSMDKYGSRTHSGKEKDKENLAGSSKPSTSKQSEDKVNNKIHDRSTINNNIANVTKGVECGDCVSDKNMSTKQAHVNSSEKSAHVKSNSRSPLSSGIAFHNNLSTGNSGNTESVKDLNRKKTTSNNAESSGVIPASVVTATSETVSRSNYKISPNIQKNDKMGNVQNRKVTWSDTVVSKQGPPQNNPGRSQNIHNNLGVPSSLSAKSLMKKIPLGPTVVPSALPHQVHCLFLCPLAKGQRAIVMALCPSCFHVSVRSSVNFSFIKLYLRSYCLDFYQTSEECSLGGPLSYSFKSLCFMKNSGCHGNQSKKPLKIFSSHTTNWIELSFCRNVPEIEVYRIPLTLS